MNLNGPLSRELVLSILIPWLARWQTQIERYLKPSSTGGASPVGRRACIHQVDRAMGRVSFASRVAEEPNKGEERHGQDLTGCRH